jgi:hypothetical protein
MKNQFSGLFFSLLTDIHLIFGTLLCHTKIQIKLEFDFDPFEFHEVMAHGLRKILQIGIFSSPELKAQVSFSDRLLSVVCPSVRPYVCLLDFYIFNFFFRTAGPILTKVGTNHP